MYLSLKNISFLIVEDSTPIGTYIKEILESLGAGAVYHAKNGEKGFEAFCLKRPDIVLTDWVMEPVDGIELTKKIRTHEMSHDRFAPVIMCSALGSEHQVRMSFDAGVTEFINKPFSVNDIVERIETIINSPRDFIETPNFFGPDRRRANKNYKGPERRVRDPYEEPSAPLPAPGNENKRAVAPAAPPQQVILQEEKPKKKAVDVNIQRLRVLVVDDNPGACLVTKTILLNMGVTQVYISHDGRKALEFLDTAVDFIDIILCDWEMPRVDGLELLRQVRATYPNLPFLMLTGRDDLVSVKAAKEAGVDSYIRKPVSIDDLQKKIGLAITMRKK